MKISVVVIAHNEEKYIEKCLSSLLNQTVKANEIIVVAHNCTDKTVEKASLFPVIVKILDGETGIAYARYHGISDSTGDKILCIDGDAVASKNWIEILSALLDESKSMMAGTRVKYIGNIFFTFLNPFFYLNLFILNKKYLLLWGPSFGFTYKMKDLVLTCMKEFPTIHKKLNLSYYPDDFWMALNANSVNPITVSSKGKVIAITKQNSWNSLIRSIESNRNVVILEKYFKQTKL